MSAGKWKLVSVGLALSSVSATAVEPRGPRGPCPFHAVLRERTTPSLNREYTEELRSGRQASSPVESRKAAAQVHALLNRVFYPMALRLRQSVSGVTPDDIKQRVAAMESAGPTKVGAYAGSVAQVELESSAETQAMVSVNATKNKLGSPSEGHVEPLAEKFAFRTPSKGLVEQLGQFQQVLGLTVTPIGFYGERLAKEMSLTSAILVDQARATLVEESQAVYDHNPRLLYFETARARDDEPVQILSMGPLATMAEGIVSINQVLASLLMGRVPGVENGPQALRAVIFDGKPTLGLLTEFTARVPLGLIGPMNLRGQGFDDALERSEDGKLALSAKLKGRLGELMTERFQKTGNVGSCPMAGCFKGPEPLTHSAAGASSDKPLEKSVSGIQLLAEAYWQIFHEVHAQNAFASAEIPRGDERRR